MADALIPLAVKLLWDESLPLRKLLYSRLPFARDAAKKQFAEEELGKLIQDSHKLSKGLGAAQADEAIDKRIAVFREDLIKGQIPVDQVNTLVSRGEMFVRMLITEPSIESAMLKQRLAECEAALLDLEAQFASQGKTLEAIQKQLDTPKRDPQIPALWAGLAVVLIIELLQLFLALSHAGATH